MKRALYIIGVLGLAGLITFLAVTRYLSQQRAAKLDSALQDRELRLAEVETELEAANARLAELTKAQTQAPSTPAPLAAATQTATQAAPAAPSASTAAPAGTADSTAWVRCNSFNSGVTNVVRIEGTSTIHDWQVEGTLIGGGGEFGTGVPLRPGSELRPGPVGAKVSIFIPVRSLKSIEKDGRKYSDAMDEIMYGKLLAETNPRITYTLTSLTFKEPPRDANSPFYVFEAVGNLCVAGVTNAITMPVNVMPTAKGPIQFSGSTRVKMTDFKVQPPEPALPGGIKIKTGDEVTLKFTWWVKPATTLEAAK